MPGTPDYVGDIKREVHLVVTCQDMLKYVRRSWLLEGVERSVFALTKLARH